MTQPRKQRVAAKSVGTNVWFSPSRLMIAAAIFHLAITLTVYGLGRSALLPGTFDTNGIAVSFAPDGIKERGAIVRLSDQLLGGEIRGWLTAPYPLNFKLYSICFFVFGPWLGYSIVAAEALNALCYVGILGLVFRLGQEVFNPRAGLLAAATVGLWPSLLLHTTQLLRDPLFILGMLGLILVTVRFLSRSFSWPRALLHGLAGGLVAAFLWLLRDNMGELMLIVGFLAAGILIIRQLLERRFLVANTVGLMLLIVIAVSVSRVVPKSHDPIAPRNADQRAIPSWAIAARIARHREKFIRIYPDAGSSIDLDVHLTNKVDLVRYLPRAAAIGFFAPFPDMWFASSGRVGSAGRLLSGLETLAMYGVEGLALVGLWRWRRRLSVWLLISVAATNMVALGLVVVNVGALYRLRYTFVILILVVAAEGVLLTFDSLRRTRGSGGLRPAPNGSGIFETIVMTIS